MDNKEAIEYLKWVRPVRPYSLDKKKVQESIDLAIKILEEKPQGDLISRDALIDVLKTELASVPQPDTDADYYVGVNQGLKLAETIIDNAPSVYDNPYSDGREDGYIEGYEQAKLEMVGPPQYWLVDDAGHFYCPQCKKYPDYQIRLMSFCPNCGCDLRGEN